MGDIYGVGFVIGSMMSFVMSWLSLLFSCFRKWKGIRRCRCAIGGIVSLMWSLIEMFVIFFIFENSCGYLFREILELEFG